MDLAYNSDEDSGPLNLDALYRVRDEVALPSTVRVFVHGQALDVGLPRLTDDEVEGLDDDEVVALEVREFQANVEAVIAKNMKGRNIGVKELMVYGRGRLTALEQLRKPGTDVVVVPGAAVGVSADLEVVYGTSGNLGRHRGGSGAPMSTAPRRIQRHRARPAHPPPVPQPGPTLALPALDEKPETEDTPTRSKRSKRSKRSRKGKGSDSDSDSSSNSDSDSDAADTGPPPPKPYVAPNPSTGKLVRQVSELRINASPLRQAAPVRTIRGALGASVRDIQGGSPSASGVPADSTVGAVGSRTLATSPPDPIRTPTAARIRSTARASVLQSTDPTPGKVMLHTKSGANLKLAKTLGSKPRKPRGRRDSLEAHLFSTGWGSTSLVPHGREDATPQPILADTETPMKLRTSVVGDALGASPDGSTAPNALGAALTANANRFRRSSVVVPVPRGTDGRRVPALPYDSTRTNTYQAVILAERAEKQARWRNAERQANSLLHLEDPMIAKAEEDARLEAIRKARERRRRERDFGYYSSSDDDGGEQADGGGDGSPGVAGGGSPPLESPTRSPPTKSPHGSSPRGSSPHGSPHGSPPRSRSPSHRDSAHGTPILGRSRHASGAGSPVLSPGLSRESSKSRLEVPLGGGGGPGSAGSSRFGTPQATSRSRAQSGRDLARVHSGTPTGLGGSSSTASPTRKSGSAAKGASPTKSVRIDSTVTSIPGRRRKSHAATLERSGVSLRSILLSMSAGYAEEGLTFGDDTLHQSAFGASDRLDGGSGSGAGLGDSLNPWDDAGDHSRVIAEDDVDPSLEHAVGGFSTGHTIVPGAGTVIPTALSEAYHAGPARVGDLKASIRPGASLGGRAYHPNLHDGGLGAVDGPRPDYPGTEFRLDKVVSPPPSDVSDSEDSDDSDVIAKMAKGPEFDDGAAAAQARPAVSGIDAGYNPQVRSILSADAHPENIIIGSGDRDLKVWDVFKGKLELELNGHANVVWALDNLPPRKIVTASGDNSVKMWHLGFRSVMRTYVGHTDAVYTVSTIDPHRFASAGADGVVIVWNADQDEDYIVHKLYGHTDAVWCSAFVDWKEHIMVTGSFDTTIKWWNIADDGGYCIQTYTGHTGPVLCLCVIKEDILDRLPGNVPAIVISGSADRTIKAWRADPQVNCIGSITAHDDQVTCITTCTGERTELLPTEGDGEKKKSSLPKNDSLEKRYFVASGSADKSIKVWQIKPTMKLVGMMRGHTARVTCITNIPTQDWIASGSDDMTVRIWDSVSCTQLQVFNEAKVFSRMMESEGLKGEAEKDDVAIVNWDTAIGHKFERLDGHLTMVRAVAATKSNDRLFSASADGVIKVWDYETRECIFNLEGHKDEVLCVAALGPDHVVSGGNDHLVKVWNHRTGTCVRTFDEHKDRVWGVASMNELFLSASADHDIRVWNHEEGTCKALLEGHKDAVTCVAVIEYDKIVSGSNDNTLKAWEVSTNLCVVTMAGHLGSIDCVAASPDMRCVSGSRDNTIRVWSLATGNCLSVLRDQHDPAGIGSGIRSVILIPGHKVVSGGSDGRVIVWDLNSGKYVYTLEGHYEWVSGMCGLRTAQIVSGGDDHTLRIWRPVNPPPPRMRSRVTSAAGTPLTTQRSGSGVSADTGSRPGSGAPLRSGRLPSKGSKDLAQLTARSSASRDSASRLERK